MPIEAADSDATPGAGAAVEAAAEWDALTTALNRWGILHVAPGSPCRTGIPRAAQDLFHRLLSSDVPRLHQTSIPLLLAHPQLAPDAQAAIRQLDDDKRDRAMRRYVAATALQRMARTRIELRLGPRPLLPPAYPKEFDLPSLDEGYGRETLWVLAGQEEARYGYDAWGTYAALLDLFLAEMRRRSWGVIFDGAPTEGGRTGRD